MYELPPANFPSPGPVPRRVSVSPRIGPFIALWLALVGGYGAYRMFAQPTRSEPKSATVVSPKPTLPPDWSQHIGSLNTESLDSEASLKRTEDEIRRTLTLTDSSVEARHLHAALANLEAAHQDVVRMRHDIESLEILLKGEK